MEMQGDFIVMSTAELIHAGHAGFMRRVELLQKGYQDNDSNQPEGKYEWQNHIEAALAEMAFAWYHGIYWGGGCGTWKNPDVGPYQIRSTWHWNGGLSIKKKDRDDQQFVLLTGWGGRYRIRGWAYGSEAKEGGEDGPYWQPPKEEYGKIRPGYWLMPNRNLHPIESLMSGEPKQEVAF